MSENVIPATDERIAVLRAGRANDLPVRCKRCGHQTGNRPDTCIGDGDHDDETIPEAEWTSWQREYVARQGAPKAERAKCACGAIGPHDPVYACCDMGSGKNATHGWPCRIHMPDLFAPVPDVPPVASTEEPSASPVPMVLHCPECRARHIDEGEFATKPHHTHACQSCGLTWRPAIVPTVGVQFLPGFKNDPPATPASDGDFDDLTIRHVQTHQPWTVPYSERFQGAVLWIPHVMGTHAALHAVKTAGKIAAVFESLDHGRGKGNSGDISEEQVNIIGDMSADLFTVALRFANLFKFDLATKLAERVIETNGKTWPAWNRRSVTVPQDRHTGDNAHPCCEHDPARHCCDQHPGVDLNAVAEEIVAELGTQGVKLIRWTGDHCYDQSSCCFKHALLSILQRHLGRS